MHPVVWYLNNLVFVLTNTTKLHISRWQTFIGAILLLVSGKLGWVEINRITRYCHRTAFCWVWYYTAAWEISTQSTCSNIALQICGSVLASGLPPICGEHLRWFPGIITFSKCTVHLKSHRSAFMCWFFLLLWQSCYECVSSTQDIPFFFTLQNCSHPFSYVIFKVMRREVSALTACCKLICSVMCFTLLLLMCSLCFLFFSRRHSGWNLSGMDVFFIIFLKRDSHISHIKRPSFSSSLCLMLLSAINLPFYDPQVITILAHLLPVP